MIGDSVLNYKYLPLLLLLIPAVIIPAYAVETPTNVHAEPSLIEQPGYFKVTWNHTSTQYDIPVKFLVDVVIRPGEPDKIVRQVETTNQEAFVSMYGANDLDDVEVYVMAIQIIPPYLTSGFGTYGFMLCQTSINEAGVAC